MNENIKELSDIAYKIHLANNPHSSFGRRSDYDLEFARLIIEECMDNLAFHGHDDAVSQLEYFKVNKFGIK